MAVEFEIYMACDLNESSRKFIGQNFAPKHMAEDATQRNWETCTLITTLGELLVMPREGVDIYIACYPCGPWSKRGKRLGLSDNDGRLYEVAINTVAILNPFAYLMENVCQIEGDFDVINAYTKERLPHFTSYCLKGIDPLQHDYPVKKSRLIQFGTNNGGVDTDGLQAALTVIAQNPMPLTKKYRQFLGLSTTSRSFWQRFDQLATYDEMQVLASKPCTCSTDPMAICTSHPCRCQECKSGANQLKCSWRGKAMDFIHAHFGAASRTFVGNATGKLTYCNVLDIYGQLDITSPRVRNMLNLVAHLPKCQPLDATAAVMDISQGIDRAHIATDGTLPTAATNSQLLCLCDASVLNEFQMGELMGHNMRALNFAGLSASQVRRLLGMSVHVSVMGVGLLALLGAIGYGS